MKKTNIVLTGFMGTGKTTVGKLLAEQLNYDFVDTDELIEQRAGKTVTEIFNDLGEAAFREMEAASAKELAGKEGLVISTGGRMMLDPVNAAALSHSGRVFCLIATPEEIFERVSKDTDAERPLLSDSNPMERIIAIIQKREKGYRQFSQINTSGKTPYMVSKNILDKFQAKDR